MTAATIIEKMQQAGLAVSTDGIDLIVTPLGCLTAKQRDYLRAHKAEVIAELLDAGQPGADLEAANDSLPAGLIEAATRVCREIHGDASDGVAAMLDDLLHYPPASWDWLADHFRAQLIDVEFPTIPTTICCGYCRQATIINGIAACGVGVESGLAVGGFWATDWHLCVSFEAKP